MEVAIVTMAGLAAKYNDFLVPALKVKAAGHDLIGASEYGVESVELTL